MYKPLSLSILLSLTTFTTFTMELPMYTKHTKRGKHRSQHKSKHSSRSAHEHVTHLKDKDGYPIPEYFARYISNQLFDNSPNQAFEDIYIEILFQHREPKLYPELVQLRQTLLEEYKRSRK